MKSTRITPHKGLIPKVIPLKLFSEMADLFSGVYCYNARCFGPSRSGDQIMQIDFPSVMIYYYFVLENSYCCLVWFSSIYIYKSETTLRALTDSRKQSSLSMRRNYSNRNNKDVSNTS